ncbi:MAG: ParB N-terminal domain-containing protein [Candidatus Eisenbacteria bacterium]|uniref:ParB N-terminal domain-containing protein n=1 Tax=Eiseniibacteriota bacterium TaxID=2212470 RepID=A0A849SGF0_UNCEI|nr:ParB N-terminal domain-containing protein [Candidatus Eisenbacteria bacterium]
MKQYHPILVIPLRQIAIDSESPHKSLGTEDEERRLRDSVERFGVMSPLLVSKHGPRRYLIIDGYRRFVVARDLGIKKLACVIHPPMESGDREALRLSLYMTFKPLTQAERLRQLRRLRNLGITSPGTQS